MDFRAKKISARGRLTFRGHCLPRVCFLAIFQNTSNSFLLFICFWDWRLNPPLRVAGCWLPQLWLSFVTRRRGDSCLLAALIKICTNFLLFASKLPDCWPLCQKNFKDEEEETTPGWQGQTFEKKRGCRAWMRWPKTKRTDFNCLSPLCLPSAHWKGRGSSIWSML